MLIPPNVTSFSGLIRWLVESHHKGNYYPMAVKLKVSPSLPYHWRDEMVREPSHRSVARVAEAYGLDFWDVWRVAYKDAPSPIPAVVVSNKPGLAPMAGRRSRPTIGAPAVSTPLPVEVPSAARRLRPLPVGSGRRRGRKGRDIMLTLPTYLRLAA